MIIEDYVSFETAKLLKEKGFDEICRKFYKCWPTNPKLYCCDKSQMFDYCTNSSLSRFNYVGDEMNIAAPTLQMTMKWLREVHDVYIDISIYVITVDILKYNINVYYKKHKNDSMYLGIHLTKECSKYEEAAEAAIKYSLENLI